MDSIKDAWRPGVYRPLKPSDEFFTEGNNVCFSSNMRKYTCNLEADDDFESQAETSDGQKEVTCLEHGCGKVFKSLLLYEVHYSLVHRNSCSECKIHLPTSHLLDLHLQERHSVMEDRKFNCVVVGCPESFPTSEERRRHVVDVHGHPSNFRFFVYLGGKQAKAGKAGLNEENKMNEDNHGVIPSSSSSSSCSTTTTGSEKAAPSAGGRQRIPDKICFGHKARR